MDNRRDICTMNTLDPMCNEGHSRLHLDCIDPHFHPILYMLDIDAILYKPSLSDQLVPLDLK